jgi:hypothetical protein
MSDRPYSLNDQRSQNEKFADNINRYWAKFGVDANARVEKCDVEIEVKSNGCYSAAQKHKVKSYEIVSSVSKFPFICGAE